VGAVFFFVYQKLKIASTACRVDCPLYNNVRCVARFWCLSRSYCSDDGS